MQGWQSARQDPTIDENSAKQEKWNSQWHETSQSMWLNYSAQNLLFTGTVPWLHVRGVILRNIGTWRTARVYVRSVSSSKKQTRAEGLNSARIPIAILYRDLFFIHYCFALPLLLLFRSRISSMISSSRSMQAVYRRLVTGLSSVAHERYVVRWTIEYLMFSNAEGLRVVFRIWDLQGSSDSCLDCFQYLDLTFFVTFFRKTWRLSSLISKAIAGSYLTDFCGANKRCMSTDELPYHLIVGMPGE